MTPKEKAAEIIEKIFPYVNKENSTNENYRFQIDATKPLAIILVEEIVNACEYDIMESVYPDWWNEVIEQINLA